MLPAVKRQYVPIMTSITATKNRPSASLGVFVNSAMAYPLPSVSTPTTAIAHLTRGSHSPVLLLFKSSIGFTSPTRLMLYTSIIANIAPNTASVYTTASIGTSKPSDFGTPIRSQSSSSASFENSIPPPMPSTTDTEPIYSVSVAIRRAM